MEKTYQEHSLTIIRWFPWETNNPASKQEARRDTKPSTAGTGHTDATGDTGDKTDVLEPPERVEC